MSAPNIKDIKAAGGEDYESWGDWWVYAAASPGGHAAQDARSHGGGSLGTVDISGASVGADATDMPRIYAAAGEQNDGTSSTTGAYGSGDSTIVWQEAYGVIEGILALCSGEYGFRILGDVNMLIDKSTVVRTGSGFGFCIFIDNDASATTTSTIRNTAVYCKQISPTFGIMVRSNNAGATLNAKLESLSVSESNGVTYGNVGYNETGGTLVVTATDVVSLDTYNVANWGCFATTAGAPAVTQTYCFASDDTATDFGGAGNVDNITTADAVTSVGGDLRLKDEDSELFDAGTAIGGYSVDHQGVERPQGVSWDPGAFELPVAETGGIPAPLLLRSR